MYGQQAFDVPPDRHYRMLHLAGEEKPPIVVLSVVVLDAEGLEAKDANGNSNISHLLKLYYYFFIYFISHCTLILIDPCKININNTSKIGVTGFNETEI